MNSSITLTLTAAIFLAVLASPSEAGPNGQNSKAPEFVVKYGNKSFYKYDLELVNWLAARDLCKFFGLQLAEFSDNTEWNFLRTSFRSVEHWIGASIKGLNGLPHDAFEWASGNGTLAFDLPLVPSFEHYVCAYADGSDHFYTDSCLNGRRKVLCQDLS